MCSVQEEGAVMPEKKKELLDVKCKCGEKPIISIRVDHSLCRNCFLSFATHKFRSSFGKSRVVRDGDKILMAVSGGNSSVAMLHLYKEGKSPRAHKKLRFDASVIYIDEGAVVCSPKKDRNATCQEIAALVKKSDLPLYLFRIEQAMEDSKKEVLPLEVSSLDNSAGDSVDQSDDLYNRLHEALSSAKSLTAKENLVIILRERLLHRVAKQLGFNKIMVGDSASRLSSCLLSDITQGRGAHVAQNMSFASNSDGDITTMRPMREFTVKEIALYNTLNRLETVISPNLSTQAPINASLNRLTEHFVMGLQADFPATVPTIFRTGTKLEGESATELSEEQTCVLCQCRLDTSVGPSSALSATEFSQQLCQKKPTTTKTSSTSSNSASTASNSCSNPDNSSCSSGASASECCGEGDGSCQSTMKLTSISKEELASALCYGCRILIREMKTINALPEEVIAEALKRQRRESMRKDIEGFLISDDPDP